jgi:hypothetical protein
VRRPGVDGVLFDVLLVFSALRNCDGRCSIILPGCIAERMTSATGIWLAHDISCAESLEPDASNRRHALCYATQEESDG